MKPRIFLTLLFLLLSSFVFSQLVHSKTSKSVDLQQGFNLYGFNTSASFGYFFNSKLKASSGLGYERKSYEFSDLKRIYFDASAFYTIYQFSSKSFLDLKTSLLFGYESSANPIFDDYSKFFIGEGVGLRFEYFAFHFLSLSVFAEQNFWQLSQPGSLSWKSGLVVSYNF